MICKYFYCLVLLTALSMNLFANANDVNSGLTLVVPNNYQGTPGTATFLGPLGNAPRTYQLLIHESLLTNIAGHRIEGLTFRLPVSATTDWPLTDATYSNYDIYLSGSVTPADRSLTFVQNIVGVQKLVRSGSLIIPASSFPFGGTPNNFGREISFDSAYVYNSGHLLIEIRHNGFSGTSRSVDAIGTAISGYGTLFSACWNGNYAGTSGTQGNFSITSLSVDGFVNVIDPVQTPTEFSLKQNYPNPFNPVTNLEFGIRLPAAGWNLEFVTLKIYDILGNELTTIVNEKKAAGNYKVIFDGSHLPTGVYYYKLTVGDFSDTKKMLLIK